MLYLTYQKYLTLFLLRAEYSEIRSFIKSKALFLTALETVKREDMEQVCHKSLPAGSQHSGGWPAVTRNAGVT